MINDKDKINLKEDLSLSFYSQCMGKQRERKRVSRYEISKRKTINAFFVVVIIKSICCTYI